MALIALVQRFSARVSRLIPGTTAGGWLGSRLAGVAALGVALYLVTFPLQDYDTFWHLAYGRAMVEAGTFINHEIFSYTAPGRYLDSHSQLAQVILFGLWALAGPTALLAFKWLITAGAFLLAVQTARLFGLGTGAAAGLTLAVLTAGVSRLVERPELFSIVLQATLIWLLFRARRGGYGGRELWFVPPLMVVWDYLHGGLFGLIVLVTFVGAELVRCRLLRCDRCRWLGGDPAPVRLDRLLRWSGITLGLMVAHPNGLYKYFGFSRALTDSEFRMYGEWMPPVSLQFIAYWLLLGAVLVLLLRFGRRLDLTTLALLLPFLVMSLIYNRAMLAFGLAVLPAAAQMLQPLVDGWRGSRRGPVVAATAFVLLVGAVLLYKQEFASDRFRFGTGVNENVFPIGSTRFVVEQNLSGNLYNMDAFGGYLAFHLSPERKIFHYNQPGVFTALFPFLHDPASRSQWRINYAIVGTPEELDLFIHDGYVPVYWETSSAVLVRNSQDNAELIDRFRIRYFQPTLEDEVLLARGRNPASAAQLLRELSVYLSYREDLRIAAVFTRLLRETPAPAADSLRLELLEPTLRHNGESVPLLGLTGELWYREGRQERAEESFLRALELAPDDYPARLGLGYLDYDRGRFEAALMHFEQLTALYPQSANAHYARGLAALKLCRTDLARRSFETFLELDPQNRYAARVRGYLLAPEQACRPTLLDGQGN